MYIFTSEAFLKYIRHLGFFYIGNINVSKEGIVILSIVSLDMLQFIRTSIWILSIIRYNVLLPIRKLLR